MDVMRAALQLVTPIYAAASDHSLWPHVLEQLGGTVGGISTGFTLHDTNTRPGGFATIAVNSDTAVILQYNEHYQSVNSFTAKAPRLEAGIVLSNDRFVAEEELLKSEYFNDFLKPNDLFHILASVITVKDDLITVLASMRPRSQGPFGENERQLLQLLTPHFRQALKMEFLLSEARKALEPFDWLTTGVFITTQEGRVCQMNAAAREIVEINDGIQIKQQQLTTWNHVERGLLLSGIHQASFAAAGNGLLSMLLHRPSGKRPYTVFVRPVRSSQLFSTSVESAGGAVVFVIVPEQIFESDETLMMDFWNFTPCEAQLANALLGGRDIREYCGQVGISTNTARTHLKRIFDKTSVTRQAELVSLLSRTLGQIRSNRVAG